MGLAESLDIMIAYCEQCRHPGCAAPIRDAPLPCLSSLLRFARKQTLFANEIMLATMTIVYAAEILHPGRRSGPAHVCAHAYSRTMAMPLMDLWHTSLKVEGFDSQGE